MIEKWKKTEFSNKEFKELRKMLPWDIKRLNKNMARLNSFKRHFNDNDSIFFTIQKKDFDYFKFVNEFSKYMLFFNKKYNGFYKVKKAYSKFSKTISSYSEVFGYVDFYKLISSYFIENEFDQIDDKKDYLISKINNFLFNKFKELKLVFDKIFKNDDYYKIIVNKVSYDNKSLFNCANFMDKIESYSIDLLKLNKISEESNWIVMRAIFEFSNYIYRYEYLSKHFITTTF